MKSLVLSLFPGADLLGRGFELAGYCVVRGPDTLLGQRIEDFHAPLLTSSHDPEGHNSELSHGAGRVTPFEGVIGGPPCQDFSRARRRPPTGHGRAMLLQFSRVVTEFAPDWWLLENVPGVPSLAIHGFQVQRFNVTAAECGLAQSRNRAFQFGSRDGLPLVLRRTESHLAAPLRPCVMANDGRQNFADLCELQGLPRSFDLPGLSRSAKKRAVGNGVPVAMARIVADAIRFRAFYATHRVCHCGCGRPLQGHKGQRAATPACRKRIERSRRQSHAPASHAIGGSR